MTTAPSTLIWLQDRLVRDLGTVNLGIVGDEEHIETGGYHIGAVSLRRNGMSGDYSLYFDVDRSVNHDYACAIDIGGKPELLMQIGNRIVKALREQDPRVYGKIRAVNAPWSGVAIDRRYDLENPQNRNDDNVQSSSDRNHIHVEFYRSYVLNQKLMADFLSVVAGEQNAQPQPHPRPTPGPAPEYTRKNLWKNLPIPGMIAQGTGHYFGLITGPNNSHGGFNANERPYIKKLQMRLIAFGFVPGVHDPDNRWADGKFERATVEAVKRFQAKHMPKTQYPGQVWYDDWKKLFSL